MTGPRVRVMEGLDLGGQIGRQIVLDEVADLEHKLYMAGQRIDWLEHEQAAIASGKAAAEQMANYEATRAEGVADLLEAVEHVLHAGRQAEVARRGLHMIESERSRLSLHTA